MANAKPAAAAQAQTVPQALQKQMMALLELSYLVAMQLHESNDYTAPKTVLGEELFDLVWQLGSTRYAARGVVLTLNAYKAVTPAQNILLHKNDREGGFSARSFDSSVTVPFLQGKGLTYNVETHWLSQTFSFAPTYERGVVLKTVPKFAGPVMIEVLNRVQESTQAVAVATAVVQVILALLIEERDKGKVTLEKPKDLIIDQVISLLSQHFGVKYTKNAPRLPQLAIYAIYECIVKSMERYQGLQLGPLERMKAANRKSGSVGDVDVNRDGQPFEAVEVKFDIQINRDHVAEAIQKIKGEPVERYLILSTVGVADGEIEEVSRLLASFKRSNGCEIIVNGVLDTIRYYLRLIRSTTDFVVAYTRLVEVDPDLTYEHRNAWNQICAKTLGSGTPLLAQHDSKGP